MPSLMDLKAQINERADSLEVAKGTLRNVVTAKMYEALENEHVTRSQLAKKMGISKAAVSGMLNGDRNFTIDKIAEFAHVLGYKPEFGFRKGNDANLWLRMYQEKYMETESTITIRKRMGHSEIRANTNARYRELVFAELKRRA